MDGIIIDNVAYKLVKDAEGFECKDCDLEKYCDYFPTSICTAAFTDKECHFEKVEDTQTSDNKQSEIINQSYFY